MRRQIPKQVALAVRNVWDTDKSLEDSLRVQELEDDWVVSRKGDEGKLGGRRLVVPRKGDNSFEIPASYAADNRNGVSWLYGVRLLSRGEAGRPSAKILAQHTGLSVTEAFKALKKAPIALGLFHLERPLILLMDMEALGIPIELTRPNNSGGYRSKLIAIGEVGI